MHNNFTLFSRKVPSGKSVFYYYAYDKAGNRLGPWSTGLTGKTAAKTFCENLYRDGKLIPGLKGVTTFEDLAEGFWDWEKSPYLIDRKKRRNLTKSYADKSNRVLQNQLLPYFGKKKLVTIDADAIDLWFDEMMADGYKNTTINGYYGVLRTMIRYAAAKNYIPGNPIVEFETLVDDHRNREIITPAEFDALFNQDWCKVWNNDFIQYAANKLAALTGMRCSEVLGLRGEFVFDNHIFVNGQYDDYGYRETKTKLKHCIPLVPEVIAELRQLMNHNGQGYVFSLNGGAAPVSHRHIYNGLKIALKNIGMTDETIEKRGIDLHAWRHFANTELLKGGLTLQQVQAVTGHRTTRMTERYTHFDPREFGEVPQIQNRLLGREKPKETSLPDVRPPISLVKHRSTFGQRRKAS